tara:strand:+ start:786 stop:1094 length:309 start_codon:yes stop_codon:yes gene_type:complete
LKKIFVSQSLIEVETLKEILEQAGILNTIKNQNTSMLAGEVPFAEVFPELWIIDDADYDYAKKLLDDWGNPTPSEKSEWTCAGCKETHSSAFTSCWNCGQDR